MRHRRRVDTRSQTPRSQRREPNRCYYRSVAMVDALQDINEIYECEQPEEPESMERGS